jgi:hypothetical protein
LSFSGNRTAIIMQSADRARRYRDRQRRLRSVVPVEVDFGLVDCLIETGMVPLDRSEDRQAIGAAVAIILAHWQETVTRDASSVRGSSIVFPKS